MNKQALNVKGVINGVTGASRRYGQLLTGSRERMLRGNVDKLRSYADKLSGRIGVNNSDAALVESRLRALADRGKVSYLPGKGWIFPKGYTAEDIRVANGLYKQYNRYSGAATDASRLVERVGSQLTSQSARAAQEARKVKDTRYFTGLGLTGLGAGAYAMSGDGEKKTAAYLEGFRKTAADLGVDPEQLLKAAAPGFLGRAVTMAGKAIRNPGLAVQRAGEMAQRGYGAAKGMGSRYMELMRGGNSDTLGVFNRFNTPDAIAARGRRMGIGEAVQGAKDLLREHRQLGKSIGLPVGQRGGAVSDHVRNLMGAQKEIGKVRAARYGTAAAGAGLVGGAMLAGSDGSGSQQAMPNLDGIMRYNPYNPMAPINFANDIRDRLGGQAQGGVA